MKKTLSVILSLVMIISAFFALPFESFAEVPGGSCGKSITYSFNNSTGELSLSGSGATYDYPDEYPGFYDYKDEITSIIVNDGITYLGEYLFYGLDSVLSVSLPSTVTQIYDNAFSECYYITDIYFSGTNSQWNSIAFGEGNDILTQALVHCSDGAVVSETEGLCGEDVSWNLDSDTGVLTLSGTGATDDYLLDSPTYSAYASVISTVAVEEGITALGEYLFYNMNGIISITLPGSVSEIGKAAFSGCTGLGDVYYSGTKAEWESISIASGNDCLTSATIHCSDGDIEPIGGDEPVDENSGTCGENAVWSFDASTGVLSISGSGATYDYENDYPGFYSKKSLISSIVVSQGITTIGEYLFYDIAKPTNISLPVSISEIKNGAFYGCDALSDVYYSGTKAQWGNITIDTFGNGVFNDATIHCTNGIYGSEDEEEPEYSCGENVFWSLNDDTGVLTLSGSGETNSYTNSYPGFYVYRTGITSIVVEEGITSIGAYLFFNLSDAVSISLPSTLSEIKAAAFSNCINLADVYYPGSNIQWKSISISETNNDYFIGANLHCSITVADNTALAAAIEEAYSYCEEDYTAESYWELMSVTQRYLYLLETPATQSEYDEATEAILEAIGKLDLLSNYHVSAFNEGVVVLLNADGNETTLVFANYINDYCEVLDVVEDGIINAKDYAYLLKNY